MSEPSEAEAIVGQMVDMVMNSFIERHPELWRRMFAEIATGGIRPETNEEMNAAMAAVFSEEPQSPQLPQPAP